MAQPAARPGTEGVRVSAGGGRRARSSGILMPVYLIGGAACILVGAILLAVFLTQRRPGGDASDSASSDEQQILYVTPSTYRSAGWTDVGSGIVVSLNDVSVEVPYVGYGEVRARGADKRVVVSDEKNYLQIIANIKNLKAIPIEYSSWYGNVFGSSGEPVAATLVDDRGNQYDLVTFSNVTQVQGHTRRANLLPSDQISDVLVFAIPVDVDRSVIRHFHLDLPAQSYGGKGSYRFEIPNHVIQDF